MSDQNTPQVDQELIDMMNPPTDFDVMGITVTATAMSFYEIEEWKKKIDGWETDDPAELVLNKGIGIVVDLVWKGIHKHTPKFANINNLKQVMTVKYLSKWAEVINHIVGSDVMKTEDADSPPEPESPASIAEKNE